MANEDMTTIQISKAASEMLEALGVTYKRSKKAHAEWLIEQDYLKLERVKLVSPIPSVEAEGEKSPKNKKSVKA